MAMYIRKLHLGLFLIVVLISSSVLQPVGAALGMMVVQAVVTTIVSEGVRWGLSASLSDKEYKQKDAHYRWLSKEDFLKEFKREVVLSGLTQATILVSHEMYKYPAFIAAIKESCPDYAQYIKKLMNDLEENPENRLVRGFETDHLYHKCALIFKGKKARDFSEFYELIKKLYAEVVAQEQQFAVQKKAEAVAADNADEYDLIEVEELIGALDEQCLKKLITEMLSDLSDQQMMKLTALIKVGNTASSNPSEIKIDVLGRDDVVEDLVDALS